MPESEPGLLILPETYRCSFIAASSLPLKDLAAVSRFLRLRNKLAHYGAAEGHSHLSRHYCRNGGVVGGGVTKAARYLLLSGHYEADISAAFHTIISSFATDLDSPIAAPPVTAIEYIRSHLLPPLAPTISPGSSFSVLFLLDLKLSKLRCG